MTIKKEKLLKILLSPHLSEKTARTADQHVFHVVKSANKIDVKAAVEALFNVKVKAVNVVNIKGAAINKSGRIKGRAASWKKAYVLLQPGQQINLA